MLESRKYVPSLFTILNAFCGLMSIINASHEMYEQAALFIIYASLFDMLDGIVARILRSSSKFGVELDSLSDVISFGVAPSFLLYSIYFKDLDGIGIAVSSMIMVFAAIRLARFNVQLVGFDKNKFIGLPTPIASITISAYILFYHNKIFSKATSDTFIIILVVAIALLMVSNFRYNTIPKLSIQSLKKSPIVFAILLLGIALVIFTKGEGLFSFCLFYVSTGIIRSIGNFVSKKYKKITRKQDNEETLELNKTKLNR